LPDGITDLLKLCAFKDQRQKFVIDQDLNEEELLTYLLYFIESSMLNEKNSNERILGLTQDSSMELQETHYQLLTSIYSTDTRPSAAYYSQVFRNANNELNKTIEAISFSDNRHQNNLSTVKQQYESQVSYKRTLIAITLVTSIFSLVAFTGKSHNIDSSKLISSNNDDRSQASKHLIKVSTINLDKNQKNINSIPDTKLQTLLKELETAYEEGNVDTIKPILANSPEIKSQSVKQLNDKLETLFQITTERKMVLFNFKWNPLKNTYQGNGRFLSRYKLVGEDRWLTREGIATVTAKADKNLRITQLILENTEID